MADLKCTDCGMTATYADAAIADSQRTCDGGTTHDWTEPIHPEIPVVTD